MKMTIINAEAAADQCMADRLAASFMREIALLKVWVGRGLVYNWISCTDP